MNDVGFCISLVGLMALSIILHHYFFNKADKILESRAQALLNFLGRHCKATPISAAIAAALVFLGLLITAMCLLDSWYAYELGIVYCSLLCLFCIFATYSAREQQKVDMEQKRLLLSFSLVRTIASTFFVIFCLSWFIYPTQIPFVDSSLTGPVFGLGELAVGYLATCRQPPVRDFEACKNILGRLKNVRLVGSSKQPASC